MGGGDCKLFKEVTRTGSALASFVTLECHLTLVPLTEMAAVVRDWIG